MQGIKLRTAIGLADCFLLHCRRAGTFFLLFCRQFFPVHYRIDEESYEDT